MDEGVEQSTAHAAPARLAGHVHGVLDHAAVDRSSRDGRDRKPSGDHPVELGDEPWLGKVGGVPFLPRRNRRLEGRGAARERLLVDPRDHRPVDAAQATNGDHGLHSTYRHTMQIIRPTPERFDETLALLRDADIAVYGDSDWTRDELQEEWKDLDLERDAWLVELDGRLAGVAHLLDRRGGRFIGDAYVHPDLTGCGVGSRVLELLEARVHELRPSWPDGERIVLECAHLVGDERAPRLFRCRGFANVRSGFRMVVELERVDEAPVWPEGLDLRPFDVGRHGRAVHAAVEEAFAEESGHVQRPYEEWRKRAFDAPRFDPSLVPVAWDGDEIAGVSLNYPKRMGNWGWVASIGVRPAWRRCGLGLALLRESFRRFRETGESVVALGVDADNPTGAVRLYERAGMRVLWRADVWQKELRP